MTRLPALPVRRADSHKGDYGRVLVIGGSRGMIGAPALVAQAALRAGAGLVTIACPASIQRAVAVLSPCATSLPLPELDDGRIDPVGAMRMLESASLASRAAQASTPAPRAVPTVVAIGPGLGQGDSAFRDGVVELIRVFAADMRVPVVADADAINALPEDLRGDFIDGPPLDFRRVVITPHPGEMARLRGMTTSAVQADRERTAARTAQLMRPGRSRAAGAGAGHRECGVVVLKGHRTVVTDGAALFVNTTGNAGMATGGAGDVLTGTIAGLIAQDMSLFDAAVLGVHLHGSAGDEAARSMGLHGLIATDLIDALPAAFREMGLRKRKRSAR